MVKHGTGDGAQTTRTHKVYVILRLAAIFQRSRSLERAPSISVTKFCRTGNRFKIYFPSLAFSFQCTIGLPISTRIE